MDQDKLVSSWADHATIPEHSLPLMTLFSGGEHFLIDGYLFLAEDDWLMAISAPLGGRYDEKSFNLALDQAIAMKRPARCFAAGHNLPARLVPHIQERDKYYVLSSSAPIPSRLRGVVARAGERLRVTEVSEFTPAHRRLWNEFLNANSKRMNLRVSALYAATPRVMASSPGNLRLLDARLPDGSLAASLLLDYAPANFVSYILGAHSRAHYAPHASDLLFAHMLLNAKAAGKRFIHLGLGVNEGILRFKRKWGARDARPYVYAQWQPENTEQRPFPDVARALSLAMLQSGAVSRQQLLANQPARKPFAMLWEVEKKGNVSWIGGTAHFFAHSFEPSFRKLFHKVDNVLFEGPLDAEFMEQVDEAGRSPLPGAPSLLQLLTGPELARLEKTVFSSNSLVRANALKPDLPWILAHSRPWRAFFTLWTTFLENQGWKQSVDMEAWKIAHAMGKNVIAMENLDEQLASLSSLPLERVTRFFRNCGSWKKMARRNLRAYLAGDLEKMMGSSAEFPTRTEHVVGKRDQRFRERMRPWLEQGRCAVFVGSAHMVNLRHMLVEDGFRVRQTPFGLWPRLHLRWRSLTRPDEEVAW